MTIFMSTIGLFVFMFSVFTVGFTAAFKRLLMFIAAGFIIDLTLIALSVTTTFVLL